MTGAVRQVRLVLPLAIVLFIYLHGLSEGQVAAMNGPCDEICSENGDCNTECLINYDQGTTCGEYGVCAGNYCGDGVCDSNEDCSNCSNDCGSCGGGGSICGNNSCEDGESCLNCPSDCGNCPGAPFVVLVNGSFDENPPWIRPNSPEAIAIGATYGSTPFALKWPDTENQGIYWPGYGGIVAGGFRLANALTELPPGDIDIILHSHGGNVLLIASWEMSRPLDHVITLGTPVNYDFLGYGYRGFGVSVNSRCQVSTGTGDFDYQFLGASPVQLYWFFSNAYHAAVDAVNFGEAVVNGDDDAAAYWLGQFLDDTARAELWSLSTKQEVWGPTYYFPGLSHGDLHEPPVWNSIKPVCA